MAELEVLEKDELLKLIKFYNDYIFEFLEEHDEGMTPVSIYEFYDNEYQELINTVYKIESDEPGSPKMELVKILSKTHDEITVENIKDGYIFEIERDYFEEKAKEATPEEIENYSFKLNPEAPEEEEM